MKKTKEEIEVWKEFRKELYTQKSKSDDDFEKYITYIAAGGLGITISFIDKISPVGESKCVWIIAVGWILLALTLFINLLSHYLSSKYNTKTIEDIDEEKSYDTIVENIDSRNKIIDTLNLISIFSLGIGIIFILIFTIINV